MENTEDNVRVLYGALKKKGFKDIGTEEVFRNKMEDESNRKALYQALTGKGFKDMGDYETFNSRVSASYVKDDLKPVVGLVEGEENSKQEPRIDPEKVNVSGREREGDPVKRDSVAVRELENLSGEVDREKEYQRQGTRIQVDSLYGDVYKELDAALKDYNKEQEDFERKHPMLAAMTMANDDKSGGVAVLPSVKNEKIRNLTAAKKMLEDSQKMMRAAEKEKDGNFVGGVGRGFKDKFFDVDTWSMGLTEGINNTALMLAADKADRGKELSDDEVKLLDAAAVNMATQAYFASDLGRGYKAGGVTAESIPFMLEMLVNPASGAGKGVGRSVLRYGLKRFGKEAMKSGAGKLARYGSRAVGDLGGSMVMTATTGLPGTVADAVTRHSGQVQFKEGENGVEYAGREGGEDWGTAAMKAFGARTIEYYSEMVGDYFAPIGDMLGKTKVAKALSTTKVGKMIDDVRASDWGKAVKDFEEKTHWNGVFGEYGEEVVGTMMNALTVGDNQMSDVTDWNQQVDTFLGVSLMGGFLSGVKTFGYRTPGYSARKKLEKADRKGAKELGDDWLEVKQSVDESTEEERKGILTGVLMSEGLTPEQKRAVLDYSSSYMMYEGVMKADEKKVDEGEKTEIDAELETAFEEGSALVEMSDRRAAKIDLDIASKVFNEKRLEELNGVEHPGMYIQEHEEEAGILVPFFNAKARYEGMIQGIREDIDGKVEKASDFIDRNTHKDGKMYSAVLKDDSNTPVYVVSGNVVLNKEGELDRESSDARCVINNGGKLEMRSIKDIAGIRAVDDPVELKAVTIETIRQQEAHKAEGEIEVLEEETVAPGDELSLMIGGNEVHGVIQQETPNGTWLVQFENPVKIGETTGRVLELAGEQIDELRSKPERDQSVEHDVSSVVKEENGDDGKLEKEEDVTEGVGVDFPRTESNDIDYSQIGDPGLYVAALKEEFGEGAEGVATDLVADKEKELEKADKIKDTIKRKREQKRLGMELEKLNAVKSTFVQEKVTKTGNNNTLPGNDNSLPLQDKKKSNEVLESVPQGKLGAQVEKNSGGEETLNQLRRRIEEASGDAQESEGGGGESQKELNRSIETDARAIGAWTSLQGISELGAPFLSGNENEVYFDKENGVLYKVNNLVNSGSLPNLFKRIDLYNNYFPETKYDLVGFTGLGDGRAVYPIYRQAFVDNATFATPEEIDGYMQALGFKQTGEAEYANDDVVISDLRPRNVLKDVDGDIYVIDADLKKKSVATDVVHEETVANVTSSVELEEAEKGVRTEKLPKVERGEIVQKKQSEVKRENVTPEGTEVSDGRVLEDGYTMERRYHQKNGSHIYALNFTERVDRDTFLKLKKEVKEFGGYYSSFGKGGFIFNSEEEGKKFADYVLGNSREKEAQQVETRVEMKNEEVEPEVSETYGAANKLVSADRYEELKKRMKEKLNRLNVGFDPELLSIGAEMAAYHVEAGARKFADYSKRMIADLGDAIRPYLKSLYVAARTLPGMEELAKEMDVYEVVMKVDVDRLGQEEKMEVGKESGTGKRAKETGRTGVDKEVEMRFSDFSYSTEGIEADYPIQVIQKSIKRDMDKIVKVIAEKGDFLYDTDSKGKTVYANVNIAPMGGDVSFILWSKVNPGYGVYVSVPYVPDDSGFSDNYHVDDSSKRGILWRLTTREDKYRGMDNNYLKVDATVKEMIDTFRLEVDRFLGGLEGKKENAKADAKKVGDTQVLNDKNSNFVEVKDDEHEDISERDRDTVRLGDGNDMDGVQPTASVVEDVQQRDERGTARVPVGRTSEGGSDISKQPTRRDERDGGERVDDSRDAASDGERGGVTGRADERATSKQPDVEGDTGKPVRGVKKRNSRNFNYGRGHLELENGEIAKIKANIVAIETLQGIEKSGKEATSEQKKILSKYVGWGGLASVLDEEKYKNRNLYSRDYNWNTKFLPYYERLRELLSEDEFRSALLSTTNAHYTAENIVRGLWSIATRLGFRGGNVLEPAMGVGNVLAFMPKSISENSNITGFEIDSVSGRISKVLYPDANIRVTGYETAFAPNTKDLVITNVPFGQNAPYDSKLDRTLRKELGGAYNLHNYFIGKSLLELKEGGVGIFITSSATLDGADSRFRDYVVSQGCDLVGAIRLPNSAFLKNAGTEVTTDILVFRKRINGEIPNGVQFSALKEVGTGTYTEKVNGWIESRSKPILVNEYFADHPEMMLGKMMTASEAGSGGLYSNASLTCRAEEGQDTDALLGKAIRKFPKDILEGGKIENVRLVEQTDLRNGSLVAKDGGVYVAMNGELSPIVLKSETFKYNGKVVRVADAVKDYSDLKDVLRELIRAEQTEKDDPVELRVRLNEVYDAFVERYGTLNANKNLATIFAEDFEHNLPFALENVRKEGGIKRGARAKIIVEKGTGIFVKRVNFPVEEPSRATNLEDAVRVSMSYRGRIDLGYIGQLTGIKENEITDELLRVGAAYLDPISGKLVDKATYLSGDVRNKLIEAKAAAEENSRYDKNVQDLEEVQPAPILFGDISYRLGTPWIPIEYIKQFAVEVFSLDERVNIVYSKEAGEWFVDTNKVGSIEVLTDPAKGALYSTERMNAITLLIYALNQRKPKIYDTISDADGEQRVFNEAETQAATGKILELNDKFIEYVDAKTEWHKRLELIYNDRYNNYRLKAYSVPAFVTTSEDGTSVIHYPGANRDIVLREHQVKAVQRSLGESTLLAHQVGTGKTFTIITTVMEMRRLGIAREPMIVVQNATLEDFAKDFMKLYPGANILVPSKDERNAENRKRLFNLIATADYDAVIIPQSFLSFIPDNEDRKKQFIQQKIEEFERVLNELDPIKDRFLYERISRLLDVKKEEVSGEEKKSKKVKDKARALDRAKTRLERKLDRKTDAGITFEQMGIDALFIDEAHNYKKIGFMTKMSTVKGIDTSESKRANSLLLKAKWVEEKNGGRNVILATGTPITNTMAEVWTMMNFVAPEILESYHIETFDDFATTFGQVEPSLEFTATGNFKIADRFKSYVNVPELVKAFRSHADVVLTEDVPEFKVSNSIPKLKDGHFTNIVLSKHDDLQDVMQKLINELETFSKLKGKEKRAKQALPLVVFGKAKQAAIDLRLLNPTFPDNPDSKTNRVVKEVLRKYKDSADVLGTQLIFCDSYQSPGEKPKMDLFGYESFVPQFNLYEDIKKKLVEGGIPEEEIAIINKFEGERRERLFANVREGKVRVLLGGTEKMGVGVNVQDRLCALHHVDAPIRPMDFEQRNGRILRQGNLHADWGVPVEVITYGVQGTLDATAYDRLRIKQNFINQMMKGDVQGRVMEEQDDEDPSGMTFSEMAATLSGDKTAQLLFIAENQLKKLKNLKRGDANMKSSLAGQIVSIESRIATDESKLAVARKVASVISKSLPDGVTSVRVKNKVFTEKFGANLTPILEAYEKEYEKSRAVAPVKIEFNGKEANAVVHYDLGRMVYELFVGGEHIVEAREFKEGVGLMNSINYQLSNKLKTPEDLKAEIAGNQKRADGMREAMKQPFAKEEELKAKEIEVEELSKQLAEKAKTQQKDREEVRYRFEDDAEILGEEKSFTRGYERMNEEVNERFNRELQRQIEGKLPKGHVYQLGRPNHVLQGAGIPDLPIELLSSKLVLKSSSAYENNHPFELVDIVNLPLVIQSPFAIFDSKTKVGSKVILTSIEDKKGNNFVVVINTNVPRGRYNSTIQINSIISLYPKDNVKDVVNWINRGDLLKYVDKSKILNWITQLLPNATDLELHEQDLKIPPEIQQWYNSTGVTSSDIDIATKIVKSFENPTLREGRISSEIDRLADELNVKVKRLKDKGDLSEGIQRRMQNGRYPGVYDVSTGEVYMIMSEIRDEADAQATMLHEVVGHKGIRGMFGERLSEFCNRVMDAMSEGDRVKFMQKYEGDRYLAAEEYVASFAETYKSPSVWRKIRAIVRGVFRGVGIDLKLSDNDLRYILWKAVNHLKTGDMADVVASKVVTDKKVRERLFPGGNVLFREKDEPRTSLASSLYESSFEKKRYGVNLYKFTEAYQDSMLGLLKLQEAIEAETGVLKDYENAYMAENQLSSRNTYELEFYKDNFFTPMMDAVIRLIGKGKSYEEILKYVVAKHGLERNDVFAFRDAQRSMDKKMEALTGSLMLGEITQEEYDEAITVYEREREVEYGENRKRDYSGLKQLTGEEVNYEEKAKEIVTEFEEGNEGEVGDLWEKVQAATKETLKKTYESGLMNRAAYDHVREMFKYYVPLRGFSDDVASDIYDYLLSSPSSFNVTVKEAAGRSSLADDPLATIGNMAESAILGGNRNLMKQKFLNLVLNRPSALYSVRRMWYIKTDEVDVNGNAIWEPSFPELMPSMSVDEVAQAVENHDNLMKTMQLQGLASQKNKGLSIRYRIQPREQREHSVLVRSAGKEYVIYVNRNPRAAQALNGLTNPDASNHKGLMMLRRMNRQLAANFTTRNPAFVLSNLSRDVIFSLAAISIKEDERYRKRFRRNLKTNLGGMLGLMKKFDKGELDVNVEVQRYFQEFLAHGGETGYTALHNVEEYKKMIARQILKAQGKVDVGRIFGFEPGKYTSSKAMPVVKGFQHLASGISFLNRCAEDVSRFTTYMTSRQMGRSVERSVADAKEVTVNFNKKGAGGLGATTFKSLYLFFNAGVQSLNNIVQLGKRNPKRFSAYLGGFAAAGIVLPLLNDLLLGMFGGDDDREYYDNLPEWVRRNNLCIWVGGDKFLTIPLPIELRAFYGMGEIFYQASKGNMRHKSIALELVDQVADLLPLNPTGGNGDVLGNFIPDAGKPFYQNMMNRDFFGKPIYKKYDYNELMPGFTKAYVGTSRYFTKSAELLNTLTGGDGYKRGMVDINPAKVEHVFEGYFGGMGKTINQLGNVITMIFDEDERVLRNAPVVNRFLAETDERNAYSRVNEEYYHYLEEFEETRQRVRGYEKEADAGVMRYAEKEAYLNYSPEYRRYEVFQDYEKDIKDLQQEIKEAVSKEERRMLENMLNLTKAELVERLDMIE